MSARELAGRRAEVVAAVTAVAPLEFVNGGGTGSVERTAAEDAVTEVAAGSGLYCPTLFDGYRAFAARPATFFAVAVTRLPAPGTVTVAGGGWSASGPPGADRLPVPTFPAGLAWLPTEGTGEVQTPLRGPGTASLRVGDRVWFRHAKAGEICEHVNELHTLDRRPAHRRASRPTAARAGPSADAPASVPGCCWDRWVRGRPCRGRRPGGACVEHIRSRPYPCHTEE